MSELGDWTTGSGGMRWDQESGIVLRFAHSYSLGFSLSAHEDRKVPPVERDTGVHRENPDLPVPQDLRDGQEPVGHYLFPCLVVIGTFYFWVQKKSRGI